MRRLIVFGMVLAIVVSSLPVLSPGVVGDDASVPRRVLLELFTATWCSGCPYADAASEDLKLEYGERISLLQYHVQDDFETAKTNQRGDVYEIADSGVPAMWFDGLESRIGADSESNAYSAYKSKIDSRLPVTSPLELTITNATQTATNITLKADLVGKTSLQHSSFNVRFVIYENKLINDDPQPNTIYNYVVRDAQEQVVSAASLPTTLTQSLEFKGTWDYDNMGAVVFAQVDDDGEVLQSHSRIFGIEDEDYDGLPDEWELEKLDTLLYDDEDDPDGDGFTNIEEYNNQTDPLVKDSNDDSPDEYLWYALVAVVIVIVAFVIALVLSKRKTRGRVEEEEENDEEPE